MNLITLYYSKNILIRDIKEGDILKVLSLNELGKKMYPKAAIYIDCLFKVTRTGTYTATYECPKCDYDDCTHKNEVFWAKAISCHKGMGYIGDIITSCYYNMVRVSDGRRIISR